MREEALPLKDLDYSLDDDEADELDALSEEEEQPEDEGWHVQIDTFTIDLSDEECS